MKVGTHGLTEARNKGPVSAGFKRLQQDWFARSVPAVISDEPSIEEEAIEADLISEEPKHRGRSVRVPTRKVKPRVYDPDQETREEKKRMVINHILMLARRARGA